ncbi:class I adenylate-forming enzyme family protein [Robbsia andropogonis]|uniref:class I adenylate-forming enzyme family protein n=1 Tax=Robbsia andropogonis TaxID=28092 RepID=UPI003D1BB78F
MTTDNLGNVAFLRGHAAWKPDNIAFIGLDAHMQAREITFADFETLTECIAQRLLADGLRHGERVAVVAANSIDYVATLLATMRAGGVAVPVNFKFPDALIAYVLQDAGAVRVFCDSAHAASVPAALPVVVLDAPDDHPAAFGGWLKQNTATAPSAIDTSNAGQVFAAMPPRVTQREDDVAMLLYTSGSSGKPKGVKLTHASHGWVVRTRLAADPLTGDRVLIAAPLYHMNALALAMLTVAAGATAVLLPQFKATHYIAAITRYRCTWLTAVPPMIAMMLREHDALAQADLSSVRVIRMGSAPVSASLLARTAELLPNARIINAYGTTEGGPVVFGPHPDGLRTPPLAVGVPHPAVKVRLATADGMTSDSDPAITEGVLQIASPGIMQGYHQRPDLAPPFTADGYYITGDVFQRDRDGFHLFVGRADDMFVSGGENIFPSEVERMLETHPGVQQAAVVPVDDEIKGTKPVAFIVRTDPGLTAEAVKQHALAHAPTYQHPRQVVFVDALPLASTNKIDRRALLDEARKQALAPAS